MEISQLHVAAFLRTRDRYLASGVAASGVFRCSNDAVRAEELGRVDNKCNLLCQQDGEMRWQTIFDNPHSQQVSEIVECSFMRQKPIDAVLLGSEVFWRIVVTPPPLRCSVKMLNVVRSVREVDNFAKNLGCVNAALSGIGRIERSSYVVVEDAVTALALGFFRRHGCDIDWVKQQLYGKRLLYIPETFPSDIRTLQDMLG
ncbi:unnamed protein product [Ectocarpus sp. 6 AP-2014]